MELKNKIYGNVNIRKGSTIGYLKQVYEKQQDNIIVEDYLKESFKEYTLIENKLRELELQMANDDQNLELVLQKYGKLQEKYIALGGFELEEKSIPVNTGCNVLQALNDGEDYELLMTFSPESLHLQETLSELSLIPIGKLTKNVNNSLTGGWQHFVH